MRPDAYLKFGFALEMQLLARYGVGDMERLGVQAQSLALLAVGCFAIAIDIVAYDGGIEPSVVGRVEAQLMRAACDGVEAHAGL